MQSKKQHLMSILVRHDHLLHNLLDILVCRLYSTIHLRSVRRRIVMFNPEIFTKLFHHLVIEIRTIISDDSLRNPITTDDFLLDESGNTEFVR